MGDKRKILIIEDDDMLCNLIKKTLDNEGFTTETALNASQALEILSKEQDYLLLLDHNLPDMTGKQLVQQLRGMGIDVPFVVMTGVGDERLAVEMMKMNARDYLIKDGNFLELLPVSITQVFERLNTEAKLAQAEKLLRESEEKFRRLYEDSPIGILIYDLNGNLVDANKIFLQESSIGSIDQIRDMNLFDDPNLPKDAKDRLDRGESLRYELFLDPRSEGCLKLCDRSAYLDVLISSLPPIGYIMYVQDITQRKLTELQLQAFMNELERKVQERTAQLTETNQRLEKEIRERIEAEKRLQLYNSEMQLFADISSELIANTARNINRIQAIIESLLRYLNIGFDVDRGQEVDCNEVMRKATARLRDMIDATGATITCDKLPIIFGNEELLELLFENLLENAIKFRNDAPPRIHVSSERQDGQWLFTVCDNGIGISPEHQEEIFSIFFRSNSEDKSSGFGMGLAICKKIVECHGGRIWVESKLGAGSTFYFSIPERQI